MKHARIFYIVVSAFGICILVVFGYRVFQQNTPASGVSFEEPTILETDPVRGPRNGLVRIYSFESFLCPFCASVQQSIRAIREEYPDDVLYIWKDFPTEPQESGVLDLHIAARCSQKQGAFWEMHDLLFANQTVVNSENLDVLAEYLKLDQDEFSSCVQNRDTIALVEQGVAVGAMFGVDATPYFLINGKPYSGLLTTQELRSIIEKFIYEGDE